MKMIKIEMEIPEAINESLEKVVSSLNLKGANCTKESLLCSIYLEWLKFQCDEIALKVMDQKERKNNA